jgi:thioesterase domain-containing protein/acyl carrier protein
MIPSYFVTLEKIPLTANGKIHRKQLPEPEIKTGPGYIEPRNEIETGVIHLLSAILGIDADKISVQANLFELGINSITLLKIANGLSGEFKVHFPLETLFNSPTVEKIVQEMQKNTPPAKLKRLVLLNRGQAAQNLYLLSADGTVYGMKYLAKLLENHYNVYGIQARGIMDTGELPATRQEVFAEYIEEIKTLQPHGPYMLGGHCFGAIITYELARTLEKQNHHVQKVIFFDEPAIMPEFLSNHIIINRTYSQVKKILHAFKKFFKMKPGPASKAKTRAESSENEKSNALPKDLEARRVEVQENFRRLFNSMWEITGIIKSPVLVFKAYEPDQPDSPRWQPGAIRNMSTQSVELIETPGNHTSMLKPPHVTVLAKLLLEKLGTINE